MCNDVFKEGQLFSSLTVIQTIQREKQRNSFQEAYSSCQMQVSYSATEREEKSITTIFPMLCLILHAKLNRHCLCYMFPVYLQTLDEFIPCCYSKVCQDSLIIQDNTVKFD